MRDVGVTLDTWLARARDICASTKIGDAIGQALQHDGSDQEHPFESAGMNQPDKRIPAAEIRANIGWG